MKIDLYSAMWADKTVPANRISRVNAAYQGLFNRLHVLKHPGFKFDCEKDAYALYEFPGQYARKMDFSALTHDLAHAVDFGPEQFEERCSEFGTFVFNTPKIYIAGRTCIEPVTGQITANECRVSGIEMQLDRMLGLRDEDLEVYCFNRAEVFFRWNPDSYMYKDDGTLERMILEGACLYTDAEIIDRLEGWFDKTLERVTL